MMFSTSTENVGRRYFHMHRKRGDVITRKSGCVVFEVSRKSGRMEIVPYPENLGVWHFDVSRKSGSLVF